MDRYFLAWNGSVLMVCYYLIKHSESVKIIHTTTDFRNEKEFLNISFAVNLK